MEPITQAILDKTNQIGHYSTKKQRELKKRKRIAKANGRKHNGDK